IGNFGAKNRVVTIYGSNRGPRFSVGCQIGVSYDVLRDRVANNSQTTSESAGMYNPFLPIFNQIALTVQKAFDAESSLIDELREMRKELTQEQGVHKPRRSVLPENITLSADSRA